MAASLVHAPHDRNRSTGGVEYCGPRERDLGAAAGSGLSCGILELSARYRKTCIKLMPRYYDRGVSFRRIIEQRDTTQYCTPAIRRDNFEQRQVCCNATRFEIFGPFIPGFVQNSAYFIFKLGCNARRQKQLRPLYGRLSMDTSESSETR